MEILNTLLQKIKEMDENIESCIIDNSICFSRELHDKHTNHPLNMTSAICIVEKHDVNLYLFISEQKNTNGSNQKFSIHLKDGDNTLLKYYDKDTKFGIHIHECPNGKKERAHKPFNGGINEIAQDIIKIINNIL